MYNTGQSLFFLSRFPRFLPELRALWLQETQYLLYDHHSLRQCRIPAVDEAQIRSAPDGLAAFARAASQDVQGWPCLYVHRLAHGTPGSVGQMIDRDLVVPGADYIGDIVQTVAAMRAGRPFPRPAPQSGPEQDITGAGFDVPRPAPGDVLRLFAAPVTLAVAARTSFPGAAAPS